MKFLTSWVILLFKAIPAVVPAPSAPYKNILSHFEGHFSLLMWPTDFISDSLQRLRRPNQAASNGEKVFPKTILPKTKKIGKKIWVLRFSRSFDHSALGWTNIFDTKISFHRFHYSQKIKITSGHLFRFGTLEKF